LTGGYEHFTGALGLFFSCRWFDAKPMTILCGLGPNTVPSNSSGDHSIAPTVHPWIAVYADKSFNPDSHGKLTSLIWFMWDHESWIGYSDVVARIGHEMRAKLLEGYVPPTAATWDISGSPVGKYMALSLNLEHKEEQGVLFYNIVVRFQFTDRLNREQRICQRWPAGYSSSEFLDEEEHDEGVSG
jgi:hypothetical protein